MRFEDLMRLIAVGVFVNAVVSSVIPKSSPNTRPIDKPLSDENHFEGDEHNVEYDHDAFLGKDEAESFDHLTPAESMRRLGIIYEKIDADKDDLVTEAELQKWIRLMQKKYVETETNRQWLEHFGDQDQYLEPFVELHWSDYVKRTYGTTEEEMEAENRKDSEFGSGNRISIARDKRRWDLADVDKNGRLTKEEFTYFVHPEEADHTRETVIEEALEDIDKDNDGFISLQEYIVDTFGDEYDEENDRGWDPGEENFREELDKDGDGKLNREEIADWVIPNDYDHSIEEARHLFSEADSDKDGFLTKSEVIEKYNLFVGSQATDYGEVLSTHDEF